MSTTKIDSDLRWRVARWMSTAVQTLAPGDPIAEALRRMHAHQIRHLPVLEDGRVVGIVSDRDLRHAQPPLRELESDRAYGRELLRTPVGCIMTRAPTTTSPGATIRKAAMILEREKIGALPVLEGDRLVGIISAEDLLRAFLANTSDSPEA
jgi:acetoin utilization protein AcuB